MNLMNVLILILAIFGVKAHANQAGMMDLITENVKNVCQHPSDKGKYWDISVKGQAEASVIKLKFANIGISGGAEFSKGEWEGVQRVLEEQQVDDNLSYRECAKLLTPLFMEKFLPQPTYDVESRPRETSFEEGNDHCDDDRFFSIRINASDGWKIDESSLNESLVDTSKNSSYSGIRNLTSDGFEIEGYVRNRGACGPKVAGVVVGHDARGKVWGKITYRETRQVKVN